MPIKKRGGNGEVFSIDPSLQLKPVPRNPAKAAKAKEVKPKTPSAPKAAPKLTKIKRRQPMTSQYVYTDGGVLVIKTPSEATKWNAEFRMRIIRDYKAPRTLTMKADYQSKYVDGVSQSQVFNILGKRVRVEYPHEPVAGTAQTVVLRTDVVNETDGTVLFLNHEEPAMRVLMVYCFLTGESIGGVPKLIVDDYHVS